MIHRLGPKGRLSRRPSEWIFVVERQGRLRPPRREVGLALVGVPGYFKITCLMRSWYLIWVWLLAYTH